MSHPFLAALQRPVTSQAVFRPLGRALMGYRPTIGLACQLSQHHDHLLRTYGSLLLPLTARNLPLSRSARVPLPTNQEGLRHLLHLRGRITGSHPRDRIETGIFGPMMMIGNALVPVLHRESLSRTIDSRTRHQEL